MNAFRYSAAAIASLLLTTATLHAQTWDGGGVGNTWTEGANWNTVPPANDGTANVAFGGTLRLTPDMNANWSIASLTFNNTAGVFVLGSVGGFTLTVGAGGITNNDNGGETINNAITLGATQTWIAAASNMVIGGNVALGGNTLTFQATASGSNLGGVISGTGGLTVTGAQNVELNGGGSNSYTGTTTVNSGILHLHKTGGATAVAGALIVGDGTGTDELRFAAALPNQIADSASVTVNSSGLFQLNNSSDTIGAFTVNAGTVTLGTGTLGVASAQMTGGSIGSTGAGQLLLNGNLATNANANAATISGNANLGGVTRSFTIAEGAATNDLNVTALVSNGGITKLGAGTLRLAGSNTFAGGLSLNAGTLAFANDAGAGAGTLTIAGGTIRADGAPRTLANALSILGSFTVGGSNDITFAGSGALNTSPTLTFDNSGLTTFSGAIGGGAGAAIFKAGAGTLLLSGAAANTCGALFVNAGTVRLGKAANTDAFTGNLIVNAGIVQLDASGQIPDGRDVSIESGATLNLNGNSDTIATLLIHGGAVTTGAGTLTVTTSIFNNSVTTTGTISGNLSLGGGSYFITTLDSTPAVDIDISAVVSNGYLGKNGPGVLRLSGNNTYALGTVIDNGTILVGSNTALGTGTLTFNGGSIAADGAARTLANAVVFGFGFNNIEGSLNLSFTGPVSVSGGSAISGAGTGLTTFSGVISGTGGLTKANAGIVRFSGAGANTYAGNTVVSAGTLQLSKTGGATAIPGDLLIGDGVGSDIVQVEQNNVIADTSNVSVFASGFFDMVNSMDIIGSLTLAENAGAAIGTGSLTLGTLAMTGSGVTVNGIIAPASIVTSASVFPALLSGPGFLLLGGGTRSFNVADGAAVSDLDISLILANGGVSKFGAGTLRLSGTTNNLHIGDTTVVQGTLLLAKNGAESIVGNLIVGDGAGGVNADIARYGAASQITGNGGTSVTVNSSGLLDLAGFTDDIRDLLLAGGNVTTGTGLLGLDGTLTSNASAGTATVSGNLLLNNQTKTFTIADGTAAVDVDITAVVAEGGIVKAGAGALRLSGVNTYAGGVTLNAGTLIVGDDAALGTGALTGGGTLQADGTRTLMNAVQNSAGIIVDGSDTLTLNGAITGNGPLTKSGAGTLTLGTSVTTAGAVTLNAGTLAATAGLSVNGGTFTLDGGTFTGALTSTGFVTQNGGDFAGALTNFGTFLYNGGAFSGSLENHGTAFFNAPFTAGGGISSASNITVGLGVTLTANGTGLVNTGNLTLSAGTIAGTSATNDFGGQMNARGTVTAPFTNNGSLDVTGLLTLSAASANAGSISVGTAESLRVNGAFSNSGVITLSGGSISGTGILTNTAGGVIEGSGAVSAPLGANAGFIHATGLLTLSSLTSHAASGELLVDPGVSLNINTPFTSAGFISLGGANARLASGIITNNGLIDGTGRITSAITNNGVIRAAAGTLALAGAVSNNAGGRLEIGNGAEMLATGGLAANDGLINLAGGRLETVTAALNNTGFINGHGTLATGDLTNNGTVTLTGGDSTVHGSVTNAATKFFRVTGDTVLFTGNFTNNGTFKNTSAAAVFAGTYTENGVFISDPASNWFFDLVVSPAGYLIGGEGDVFIIGQDFLNGSAAAADWDTASAALEFSGSGEHTAALAGVDFGPSAAGYAANFAWKSVSLGAGEALTLMDGNAEPGGALYTRTLILEGGLAQIAAVRGDGHSIYYSPGEAANAWLAGGTYPLTGGGSITPIQTVLEILNSTVLPAGAVEISVLGVPGGLHRVEASADLVTWTVIGNASAAPDGTFTFTDNGAPVIARRFYRVSFP